MVALPDLPPTPRRLADRITRFAGRLPPLPWAVYSADYPDRHQLGRSGGIYMNFLRRNTRTSPAVRSNHSPLSRFDANRRCQ